MVFFQADYFLKKHTAPALTFFSSYFPASPPISTALEIKTASSSPSHDTRRANQEALFGITLAVNRCGRKDRDFFHIHQQLGTWHQLPIAQDEKRNFGISRLQS
jgi:hypothetical protein